MIYHLDTTDFPGGQRQFVKDFTPSAAMMFSEGIGAGFRDVSFMLAKSVFDMDKAENQPLLTKEDWEASKFFDEAIKWDESFTTPKARLLKERRDRERELGFLLERAGAGSTAAFYGGALVGTVPDPINLIPFLGIASKSQRCASYQQNCQVRTARSWCYCGDRGRHCYSSSTVYAWNWTDGRA